ncbi:MAG: hypothetical protein ABIH70_10285 [Chloroflexota bacterium]
MYTGLFILGGLFVVGFVALVVFKVRMGKAEVNRWKSINKTQ